MTDRLQIPMPWPAFGLEISGSIPPSNWGEALWPRLGISPEFGRYGRPGGRGRRHGRPDALSLFGNRRWHHPSLN